MSPSGLCREGGVKLSPPFTVIFTVFNFTRKLKAFYSFKSLFKSVEVTGTNGNISMFVLLLK